MMSKILRMLALLTATTFLSAGVFTAEPLFDESNSRKSQESAGFQEFEAIWRTKVRGADRLYAAYLGRGTRVIEVGDMIVLQRKAPLRGYEYIGLNLSRSNSPLICEFFTLSYAEKDARRSGVDLVKLRRKESFDYYFTGERDALLKHVLRLFVRRNVWCKLFRPLN